MKADLCMDMYMCKYACAVMHVQSDNHNNINNGLDEYLAPNVERFLHVCMYICVDVYMYPARL